METVHLKTGADGDRACAIVRDLADKAGNARSGEMYQRYIAWTEEAERMLASIFDDDTVVDVVHTPRYWMLRTAPSDTHRLPALVDTELDGRRRALTEIHSYLVAQRQRWRSQAATLVVVDTNIFLDSDRKIEDVEWLAVANSRPGVRLVVPLIVIHELDRLKRQGNSTTAKLAREAIRWLAAEIPHGLRDRSRLLSGTEFRGVTIETVIHDGPKRPDDADEVIIDFARQIKSISGMTTKLVTRDLGMQLRAQAANIDALLLDSAAGGSEVIRR